MRGLAALNVVLCHFVEAFYPSVMHGHYPIIFAGSLHPSRLQQFAELPLVSVFYSGHVAVLIFFVLSGYVLALPFYQGQPEKLAPRLAGRFVRLDLPVAAAVGLSWVVARPGFYANRRGGNGRWVGTIKLAGAMPPGIGFNRTGV